MSKKRKFSDKGGESVRRQGRGREIPPSNTSWAQNLQNELSSGGTGGASGGNTAGLPAVRSGSDMSKIYIGRIPLAGTLMTIAQSWFDIAETMGYTTPTNEVNYRPVGEPLGLRHLGQVLMEVARQQEGGWDRPPTNIHLRRLPPTARDIIEEAFEDPAFDAVAARRRYTLGISEVDFRRSGHDFEQESARWIGLNLASLSDDPFAENVLRDERNYFLSQYDPYYREAVNSHFSPFLPIGRLMFAATATPDVTQFTDRCKEAAPLSGVKLRFEPLNVIVKRPSSIE